jgi:hypothetical protein
MRPGVRAPSAPPNIRNKKQRLTTIVVSLCFFDKGNWGTVGYQVTFWWGPIAGVLIVFWITRNLMCYPTKLEFPIKVEIDETH